MIEEYIHKALEKAKYEIIKDKEPYYGQIKELPGVWATGRTLEECRRRLAEVIEGWILVRVKKSLPIPSLEGCKIEQPKELAVGA